MTSLTLCVNQQNHSLKKNKPITPKKMNWLNTLLDMSVLFSFDRSGFIRHCPQPLPRVDLSGSYGIVSGASSGIGLACSSALVDQGMRCHLIARRQSRPPKKRSQAAFIHSLDLSDLTKVNEFALQITEPIDVLVHNAGSMPESLNITKDGYELIFSTQVLAPFILTKTLADLGKLRNKCRVIFVSSGGMYLKKLDLSDLLFTKTPYSKYQAYANAKKAQVILAKLFAEKYPHLLFSSMHPGWVDTAGIRYAMPLFHRLLKNRLRAPEQGADTILWLSINKAYPNGLFWFDRSIVPSTIFNLYRPLRKDEEELWEFCTHALFKIKDKQYNSL
ncbi:MAG: SDR family NAD(P)-dependent oxidoreductase [Parachlamydiaceae bacterium]